MPQLEEDSVKRFAQRREKEELEQETDSLMLDVIDQRKSCPHTVNELVNSINDHVERTMESCELSADAFAAQKVDCDAVASRIKTSMGEKSKEQLTSAKLEQLRRQLEVTEKRAAQLRRALESGLYEPI